MVGIHFYGNFMGEPGYGGEVLAYDGVQIVSWLSKGKRNV